MKVIVITDEDVDNTLLTDEEIIEMARIKVEKGRFELIRSFARSGRYQEVK